MSTEPVDFDVLLSNKNTNDMIEALIRDQAFSVKFIASTIAHYYLTILHKKPKRIKKDTP